MKDRIAELLADATETLCQQGSLPEPVSADSIVIERSRSSDHGDFASNLALALAKNARCKPRELAEQITALLAESVANDASITKVEIAGPGFINFFIDPGSINRVISEIITAGDDYGHSTVGNHKSVLLEYVSANPTGPLHVGHGRGAAYGSALAALLKFSGYKVEQEYYVNDAGRQMDILATSIWIRYLQAETPELPFPNAGYQGTYIGELADQLRARHGHLFQHGVDAVTADLPADSPDSDPGDNAREAHINGLIGRAKTLLQENYATVHRLGNDAIVADIRDDLREFGVVYDHWFEESSLVDSGAVESAVDRLREAGHLYQRDGAWWFRSTEFGDQKDRVVIRDNGEPTYFATDIAYHLQKLERGFDQLTDIWGADHHGYVPRVRASISALGGDPNRLEVLLVQFAVLYRGSEKLAMSTRSGQFVTLRELREEVGNDATRFFYLMHKPDQHMDFDLELAKSSSNENPVYYVQYAHARICSVFRQLQESGRQLSDESADFSLLSEPQEQAIIAVLNRFSEGSRAGLHSFWCADTQEPEAVGQYDFHRLNKL